MSAELAARRTAAEAVLADYRRALTTKPPGNGHGLYYWATRLSGVLADVLSELSRAELTQAEPGGAYLAPGDMRTVLDALDVAADYKRDRAANCPDCDASPADLCSTCAWRLHMADGYDDLAKRIGGTQ
jgi:hypothetical protein